MTDKYTFKKLETSTCEVGVKQDIGEHHVSAYMLIDDEGNQKLIICGESTAKWLDNMLNRMPRLASKAGSAKSEAKTKACKANGKKGGRPYVCRWDEEGQCKYCKHMYSGEVGSGKCLDQATIR